jgi:hypothetical protein
MRPGSPPSAGGKNAPRVARVLHGVAANVWEPLKQKENCCDNTQHPVGRRSELSG